MELSMWIQYLIIAVLLFFAVFYLYRILKKNFTPKNAKDGKPGCDSGCGCS